MLPESSTFPAPAKLNLMLRVTGRRADGYHLLHTVFRLLDYGDDIRLTVRSDGQIRRTHVLRGVSEDADLSIRAARLLQAVTGTSLGADIEVRKKLPLGGGLGGGSSDAASVLLGLNHLWGTRLARGRLQKLALKLGADVPVFVFGQSAIASGIGEVLGAVTLAPAWYVVLTPPVSIATAEVFAHPDLKRDSKPFKITRFSAGGFDLKRGNDPEMRNDLQPENDSEMRNDLQPENDSEMRNDLQPLVSRLYPEVARHLDWLGRYGSARMTGSGASVFAEFEDEDAARAVLAALPPTMRGFAARGLDEHPLRSLAD